MSTIAIVLPVFNPTIGWADIISERFSKIKSAFSDDSFQLIIVNDGTPGLDTAQETIGLKEAIPELEWVSYMENRGKGYALRQGVAIARSSYIVFTDIDWPYTHESVVKIITGLKSGADVVVGVRDSTYYSQLPVYRRFISRSLRLVNGFLLRLKVSDTQAGLKGFTSKLSDVFVQTTIDRYLFDLEFIYRLSREKNIRIEACPIELRQDIVFSKMNRKILFEEGNNFLRIWLKN